MQWIISVHNNVPCLLLPAVGGGSAGAVMASRLSEIPHATVLLLEAGIDETEISDVPVMAGFLQLTDMDWKYKTEPQNSACLGMAGRVSIIPECSYWATFSHCCCHHFRIHCQSETNLFLIFLYHFET